jgi:Flp pilus assembly protein TadG
MTRLLKRFTRNRKGNVAITFAFASIPTIYLLGMALDFSSAARRQAQLNDVADAAAIAAVTPSMMAENSTVASAQAKAIFNGKAANLPGLQSVPTPTVTITNNGLVRTAVVSYTAQATNNFPSVLGKTSWTIGNGTGSVASSTVMPNINFYLLLDASPSMAIAGTPDDIATMVSHTASQGGCAFACHESHPVDDNLGNPGGEDNYALARNLGVTLRIDLMAQATAALMTTAKASETAGKNTYKMALYTFDSAIHAIQGTPTSNLTSAATLASGIQVLQVYNNNCLTSSNCNDDTDTDFDNAMSNINSDMPNPGGGTNVGGDTPQEVLFIVSDGVDDKTSSTCSQPTIGYSGGTRCQQPFSTTWCTTIKNRGIRIAVLYTEYLLLPTNSWYQTGYGSFLGIAPFQPQIATNMQACASPGLFFDVQSGGDISSAMTALFQTAVATARLTQ